MPLDSQDPAMNEKPPLASITSAEPDQRLYGEMLRRAGVDEIRNLLSTFVERGDIDVLRFALESGLVVTDKFDLHMLACVFPLVDAVPDSEKARAKAFVAEWRAAFEPFDYEKLDMQLATAGEATARLLISLGANPNGFGSSNRNITALGRTFSIRHFESALVMLKTLAERDELPLQAINVIPDATVTTANVRFALVTDSAPQDISYFHALLARVGAGPGGASSNVPIKELGQLVRRIFSTIEVPESWRKDMARSLVKATTAKGLWKSGERAEIFGELMVQAQFGSGWHPDEILVPSPGELRAPQELTWLQAAAHHGKPSIVMALLEAGADPNKRSYDGTGMNACDLAQKHPETLAVLTAWKAKTAVDSVIRNSGVAGLFC
jgi:hypothetical protein